LSKDSIFFRFPLELIFCFFDNSHSNRCEVTSYCDFNLHFLDDLWCWTFLYIVGHFLSNANDYCIYLCWRQNGVFRRLWSLCSHMEESKQNTWVCKWGLLKIRERKYKGSRVGRRWSMRAETACFSFSGAFKTYTNPWGGQTPGGSHPIITSGEGHGRFPARWAWSGPSPGNLHEPQTFPTSSLPHLDTFSMSTEQLHFYAIIKCHLVKRTNYLL
jgi:hypothetical protein